MTGPPFSRFADRGRRSIATSAKSMPNRTPSRLRPGLCDQEIWRLATEFGDGRLPCAASICSKVRSCNSASLPRRIRNLDHLRHSKTTFALSAPGYSCTSQSVLKARSPRALIVSARRQASWIASILRRRRLKQNSRSGSALSCASPAPSLSSSIDFRLKRLPKDYMMLGLSPLPRQAPESDCDWAVHHLDRLHHYSERRENSYFARSLQKAKRRAIPVLPISRSGVRSSRRFLLATLISDVAQHFWRAHATSVEA